MRAPDRDKSYLNALGAGIVLSLSGAVGWGWLAWQQTWDEAERTAHDRAVIVANYVERLIQTQTATHVFAEAGAQSRARGWLRSRDFHRILAATDDAQPFTIGTAVVGFDGEIVASSRLYPVEGQRFGSRDYLDAIRGGAVIFVDRIRTEPNGVDALVIASRFRTPEIEGAIVSAIETTILRDFLRQTAPGPQEAASLMTEAGKLLVRSIPSEPTWLAPGPWTVAVEDGYMQTRVRAQTDGVERLYTTMRVGDLPLYATFGVPVSAITSAWLRSAALVWAILLGSILLMTVLSVMARRRMQHEYELRLSQQEADFARRTARHQAELLKEAHHRIKNNLALVVSMIGIQQRLKGKLDAVDLRARIGAIAEMHDLLYRSATGGDVDLALLLNRVLDSPAMVPAESGIAVRRRLDGPVSISARIAAPVALVAIELVANAVKHAFPGRAPGTVEVALARTADGAVLTVSDDGVGIGATDRHSGRSIVDALVEQVDGTLAQTSPAGDGTTCELRFPIRAPDPAG